MMTLAAWLALERMYRPQDTAAVSYVRSELQSVKLESNGDPQALVGKFGDFRVRLIELGEPPGEHNSPCFLTFWTVLRLNMNKNTVACEGQPDCSIGLSG